jgi:hypothetical protein
MPVRTVLGRAPSRHQASRRSESSTCSAARAASMSLLTAAITPSRKRSTAASTNGGVTATGSRPMRPWSEIAGAM